MKIIHSSFRYPNLTYNNRKGRALFTVRQFEKYIGKNILDIGASNSDIKHFLDNQKVDYEKYISVDLNPSAEYVLNLDSDKLPFDSDSFETVICTDVLEHLNEFHDVFNQIVKIAINNVIISLPNAWFSIKKNLFLENSSGKFYGLPSQKPMDRHRWFFNISEAERFFTESSQIYRQATFFLYFYPTNKIIKKLFKLVLSHEHYNNLFCPFLWILIEK